MSIFGSQRDVSFFRHINRELLWDVVTQQCAVYKLKLDQTKINIYGEASGDKFSFHLFSQKKFFAAKATHRCIQQTFFRSRNSGFRVFSALHQLFQSSNLFQIISFSFSSGRSDKKKRGAKKMAASSWNEDFVFCHVFHEPAASKKQSSGKTTTKTKPLMNRCCRCRVSFVSFRVVSFRIGSLRANH